MRIEIRNENDVLVVKVTEDRLDSYVATEFRDQMDQQIAQGTSRIVLDLSEVEFVDSSGLGAIVTTQKRLGSSQDLVICGAGEAVLRLFRLARLDKILQIAADQRQALEVLSD
jgi:anti-sigma B factor antagonist